MRQINKCQNEKTKKLRGKTMKLIICIFIFFLLPLLIALLLFGNYRRNFCSGTCPSWMKEYHFAHRGIISDANTDENSMGAFRNAVDAGYAIELDLRFTKDMIPMVIHDNNLSRMCGVDKKLSDLTYEEARQLTYLKSGEPIVALEDVLNYVAGRVPLLIEIKAYHIPGEFEENIVKILSGYDGLFAIQSYNPFALNFVKNIDPSITVGLLLDDVPGLPHYKRGRILKDNLFCFICRPAFITYNIELVEPHELDLFRTPDHIVIGFLFSEEDIEKDNYKDLVDGIVFERNP
nr:hypothetical protein [Clostridia bacterium]